MSMWEWVLVFFIGSMIANGVLRLLWGKAYFLHRSLIDHGYEKGYDIGYWDGCTNIKMYHALMDKKVPSFSNSRRYNSFPFFLLTCPNKRILSPFISIPVTQSL